MMNIAFVLSSGVVVPTDGVVSQGLTWKKGLEELGHSVTLVNMWDRPDWKNFDIVHFFGFSRYAAYIIDTISGSNPNIVVSPVLDPDYSIFRLKVYAHWGIERLNLTNQYHSLSQVKHKVKLFLTRSEFEKRYVTRGFGIDDNSCTVVPLAYSEIVATEQPRENFCLHISLLTDRRKNVRRLIEAAKKYDFKLVLAGKLKNEEEIKRLNQWIANHPNIEFKGFISREEMADLYSRAKVFALPSLNEGVGIVALDAAAAGCDIVITDKGGPKEYYGNLAVSVDPESVDEIGKAISDFLNGTTYQPELSAHIIKNYSLRSVSSELLSAYNSILK